MEKMLSRAVAVTLVIIVAISSLGLAVAQENSEEIQPQAMVAVLAVDVPHAAQVNEPVTITVKDRGSGAAVEGAVV